MVSPQQQATPALTLLSSPLGKKRTLSRNGQVPEEAKEPLSIARQNALRLLKLINDLLELARLDDGRAGLRPEPVDLSVFLPALVDSVRHLAQTRQLCLDLQAGRD